MKLLSRWVSKGYREIVNRRYHGVNVLKVSSQQSAIPYFTEEWIFDKSKRYFLELGEDEVSLWEDE
jgi:antirestriction protein ArdC